MPEILGRVTSKTLGGPRGPDVIHRVKVRREWLIAGDVVELEVPRNLACASCAGGGCDVCDRAGAVTLRQRGEPVEVVEVTLPRCAPDELPDSRGITLRIPEQGGLPEPGSDLPRGVLLLQIIPAAEPDSTVKVLGRAPSLVPPKPEPKPETKPVLAPASPVPVLAPKSVAPKRRSGAIVVAAIVVVVWILLLIWLRLSGLG